MMLVMQCQCGCSVHLCIPLMIPEGHVMNSTDTSTEWLRWEGISGDRLVQPPA